MTQPSEYVRFAKLELKPPPEPEPAKIILRNTKGFPNLIVSESEAWDLYLLLDKHFNGGTDGQVD
jgi:hypothetical protein